MTPIRVAIGLLMLGLVFGFMVGKGAHPAILLVVPAVATGFIYANKGCDR